MPAQLAAAEAFPVLVTRFTCGCGATHTRYGFRAGELPPGWVYVREANVRADDPTVACSGCALAARTPAMGPV